MSFVEAISAATPDLADQALVVCVGGIVLLVTLLLTVPAIATALRLVRIEGGLRKFFSYLLSTLHPRDPR